MEAKNTKKKRTKSLFPKKTLLNVLKVAQAIQDNNGGNPYDRIDLSKALDSTPTSSAFQMLVTGSHQFGLTNGSYAAEYISLTELGRSIVAPLNEDEKNRGLLEALLSIEVFKSFYEMFDNKRLPDEKYVHNTLSRTLGVPPEQIERCYQLLVKNAEELEILEELKGSLYIRLSKLNIIIQSSDLDIEKNQLTKPEEDKLLKGSPDSLNELNEDQEQNQVFLVHGKNTLVLDQLKKILDQYKVPYLVAIDEPHGGMPISRKVAELMKLCTSAIVIFTADEKYTNEKGDTIYRPSDNAVFELGASSILYGNKIVILKEERVSLASDFSDLGYISFEENKLEAKGLDILKEFIGLGFLKVIPT